MSPDGVLVVDKPGGATSHDIVAQARRIFATRAVGHAGTLDPMATGVLLLLFGEATKLSGFLTRDRKRYLATVCLGKATDTLDADGATTVEAAVPAECLSPAVLGHALEQERMRLRQVPPAVSALKVHGRRAYALARAGTAVELPEREVRVEALTLVSCAEQSITLELTVSKGYYVRALARDLGQALTVPAHLGSLRRLASGSFELGEACAWPAAPQTPLLGTGEAARRALPHSLLSETGERRARLGQRLEATDFLERGGAERGQTEVWFSPAGEIVALGHERETGEFRVLRGFQPTKPAPG